MTAIGVGQSILFLQVFVNFYCFNRSYPKNTRWHLFTISMNISLIITSVECIFTCLLAMYVTHLKKWHISPAHGSLFQCYMFMPQQVYSPRVVPVAGGKDYPWGGSLVLTILNETSLDTYFLIFHQQSPETGNIFKPWGVSEECHAESETAGFCQCNLWNLRKLPIRSRLLFSLF